MNAGTHAAKSGTHAVAPRDPAQRGARADAAAVQGSRPFKWLARAGFLARSVTYGLIGALALALALGAGTSGAAPDQEGALTLVARTPLGGVAVLLIAAGLLGYALWRLGQAILGRGPEGGGSPKATYRIANFAVGVGYLAFFAVAVRTLTGSAGNATAQTRRASAGVLGWPGGRLIVGIAGAVLIAIGLFQAVDAMRGGFARDIERWQMTARQRRALIMLGRVGLAGRGAVFALVGYFLLRAAIAFSAAKAVGIDGALARLHHQPYGPWLVGLVACGLLAFAAFSLAESRFRRL
jgi:hypothetical protein